MPPEIKFGFEVEEKGRSVSLVQQVHGSAIVELSQTWVEADGVFTDQPNSEVYVFTADCVPVLFLPRDRRDPIAAIHAGWRGTKLGIVARAVEILKAHPQNYSVVLGPAILGCCFEVREDFISEFQAARGPVDRFLDQRSGKHFFRLVDFIIEKELGGFSESSLRRDHLRCTFCSAPPLPSYRRNGSTETRIRSWVRN